MTMTKAVIPKEECLRRYSGGESLYHLANLFCCAPGTVRKHLDDWGVRRRSVGDIRLNLNDNLIVKLYTEDWASINKIARRMKCSETAIKYRLKSRGIKIRSKKDYYGMETKIRPEPKAGDAEVS